MCNCNAAFGHGCHTIHFHKNHTLTWDRAHPPACIIAPGDVVEFDEIDPVGGQLSADATLDDLKRLDLTKANPISGPVYVDGAEPGDALKVTLLDFQSSGWGWTAVLPGFGLLADDFPDHALNTWKFDRSLDKPAIYGPGARIPLKPFCGTIGVAPAEPGPHGTIPPHAAGGNMDIRDLTVGVALYLPVRVPGALFSLGDTHAAQGDGEVCGTAIESPMGVTAKIELVKGANLAFPRFTTQGPVTRHIDGKGYEATTGIGPDLMEAARASVRGMIEVITREHGMSAENAYMLCSVCADLRISEVVDRPNWVVSCYLPRSVFD